MLLVAEQCVCIMAFEVIPDLLNGIELGRIAGEGFNVEPRIVPLHLGDEGSLVYTTIVPQEDDRSPQVPQKCTKERGHMGCLKVALLEPEVQTHMFAHSRYTEGCQGRDAVVSVVVMENRCLPGRCPCPSAGRDEKKAAFIEEQQMGPKSLRLFLYVATCSASNEQWPLGPVGSLDARVLDRTSPRVVTVARRDWDGIQHRIPCG